MYLKNVWYVAARSSEVGTNLLGRTICEKQLMLYRKDNGDVVALDDLCPHRLAPLHLGRKVGDTVQCGYHGLVFGETGECVRNPHHGGVIARAMRVTAYPIREIYSMIWIWLGDPEAADPALIPDFSCYTAPGFAIVQGLMDTAANYELITDNLLDLTHAEFLHDGLLSNEAITTSKLETLESGSTVWSNRWCPDDVPPPVWGQLIKSQLGVDPSEKVDHWLYMRWDAPAHMLLDVGITPVGQTREDGVWAYTGHHLTPVSPTRSLYFWVVAYNHAIHDPAVRDFWQMSIDAAFVGQDKPMIEAQQAALGNRTIEEMKPVAIAADLAGAKARRTLARLIAEEGQGIRPKLGASPLAALQEKSKGTRAPVLPAV